MEYRVFTKTDPLRVERLQRALNTTLEQTVAEGGGAYTPSDVLSAVFSLARDLVLGTLTGYAAAPRDLFVDVQQELTGACEYLWRTATQCGRVGKKQIH